MDPRFGAGPRAGKAWEDKHGFSKDKLEPTLAEKAQQEKTGITPEERRAAVTQAYEQADSAEAFRAALDAEGYVLAKGDRRGFVIVDRQCDVHSLTRYIKGHNARCHRQRWAQCLDLPISWLAQFHPDKKPRAQAGDLVDSGVA